MKSNDRRADRYVAQRDVDRIGVHVADVHVRRANAHPVASSKQEAQRRIGPDIDARAGAVDPGFSSARAGEPADQSAAAPPTGPRSSRRRRSRSRGGTRAGSSQQWLVVRHRRSPCDPARRAPLRPPLARPRARRRPATSIDCSWPLPASTHDVARAARARRRSRSRPDGPGSATGRGPRRRPTASAPRAISSRIAIGSSVRGSSSARTTSLARSPATRPISGRLARCRDRPPSRRPRSVRRPAPRRAARGRRGPSRGPRGCGRKSTITPNG